MAPKHLIPVAAALAALACSGPSTAADIGSFTFGAVPIPTRQDPARSYFTFTLRPGGAARDKLVVTNSSVRRVTLSLTVSQGATAQNSGSAFLTGQPRCHGAACWIHGLPRAVSLGPRRQRVIPFSVHVPTGAPLRQYLAGITLQPAVLPTATTVRSGNGIGAKAIVIHQVNVGVAFTVGSLASMTSRLQIVKVVPVGLADLARLLILERNVGDTFLKATGRAVCLAGAVRHAYPVASDTVLPGNSTTLAVNTPGLPSGANLHCRVMLDYTGAAGRSAAPARWHGLVKIPKLTKPHVVQTGPGSYSVVPKAHIPQWAIALIAGGGALVLVLLVVIVVLLRRRPSSAT